MDLVGEVLEGAHGDALLGRVAGGPVVLGEFGDNDLRRANQASQTNLWVSLVVDVGGCSLNVCSYFVRSIARVFLKARSLRSLTWVLPLVPSVPLSSMGSW